jgi:hypothetical protein
MFPLLENVSLNADQSLAATRLLLRIAHVDGAKDRRGSGADPLVSRQRSRRERIDWPAFDTLQAAGTGR